MLCLLWLRGLAGAWWWISSPNHLPPTHRSVGAWLSSQSHIKHCMTCASCKHVIQILPLCGTRWCQGPNPSFVSRSSFSGSSFSSGRMAIVIPSLLASCAPDWDSLSARACDRAADLRLSPQPFNGLRSCHHPYFIHQMLETLPICPNSQMLRNHGNSGLTPHLGSILCKAF